jgi:hypothetical protein
MADPIPMTWLDPLLTGPDAVIGKPPYGCPDIERLLNALRQRTGWQPIETAPEGIYVLVYSTLYPRDRPVFGKKVRGKWHNSSGRLHSLTHWMDFAPLPLPDPPRGEKVK